MDFSITVNTKDFIKMLKNIDGKLDGAVKEALQNMGEELLSDANKQVPVESGALKSSGDVKKSGSNSVEVGYHTVYAARLHEHPEFNFKNGKKGKYLEDPLKNNLPKWEKIFIDRIKKLI
jgi:hypothetical protein